MKRLKGASLPHIPHQIAYKNSFSKRPQYFLCETENLAHISKIY